MHYKNFWTLIFDLLLDIKTLTEIRFMAGVRSLEDSKHSLRRRVKVVPTFIAQSYIFCGNSGSSSMN